MFHNAFKDRNSGMVEMKRTDVCILNSLVNMAYSGQLIVNTSNVQAICCEADYLLVACLTELCSHFLAE